MDVQKTMEFILEQQAQQQAQSAAWRAEHEALHTRQKKELDATMASFANGLASLTTTVDRLADHVRHLDQVMETLAEAQIQNQDRFRQTDERIATLVSAIGEFLGRPKN